ncbi:hypothetical protein SAMN05446037_1005144 [Anaerovirgula multivorans]|uniref:Uncharacterized protein n=1 Tax=Anaerovirgula multivorans TaxID=312168 RepID=A0A239CF51_9FIRM|nr:hypothetical protein SAMN05446037_1005144 [Anaerovirgula multivorans]
MDVFYEQTMYILKLFSIYFEHFIEKFEYHKFKKSSAEYGIQYIKSLIKISKQTPKAVPETDEKLFLITIVKNKLIKIPTINPIKPLKIYFLY